MNRELNLYKLCSARNQFYYEVRIKINIRLLNGDTVSPLRTSYALKPSATEQDSFGLVLFS